MNVKRKKIRNRTITAFMVVLLFLSCIALPNVFAKTDQEKLDELVQQIENSKDNAESYEKLAEALLSQISNLDSQIQETTNQIDSYTAQKIQVEADLAASQAELEQPIPDKAYYQKLLEERLSVMYMYGDTGYLDVLFGATDFSDFISKVEMISSVIAYDNQIADKLQQSEDTIQQKTNEIAAQNENLAGVIASLDSEQQSLESQKNAKNAKMLEYEQNATYWTALADQQANDAADLRRIIAASGSGSYGNNFSHISWPLPGRTYLSDYYGYRIHPITGNYTFHYGVDVPAPYNTQIIAPLSGKVIFAGYKYSFGNTVILECGVDTNGNKYSMMFCHQNSIIVNVGDIVTQGQVIGLVGSTGDSTGAHLHFSVLINGSYVNPLDYVTPK